MASSSKNVTGKVFKASDRIGLKKISGVQNLKPQTINEILSDSIYWIRDFYNVSAGTRKVTCRITVEKPEGSHFSDNLFDLSTSDDLLLNKIDNPNDQPYIFLSDLLNFIEQIRTSLKDNKNLVITRQQVDELDKAKNIFELIGVHPSNNKVTIEELKRIENEQLTSRIIGHIQLISNILAPSIGPIDINKSKKDDEKLGTDSSGEKSEKSDDVVFLVGGKSQAVDTSSELESGQQDNQSNSSDQKKSIKYPESPDEKTPLKISELDPQAKLYIQSLSIITINQALSKYFNEASLAKVGLPPGTVVTFDQLPFNIRQQLMDRAFSQVENLLLSGQFSLDKLISEPAQRINFSSQAALGLLMDVHGLNLLNNAVRDIAKYGEKKIKENEKTQLTEEQLSQKVKNEKENVLNSQQAEKILEENKNNPDFAKIIESELSVVSSEPFLDELFSKKIAEITGYQDSTRIRLVIENVRPLIEVFIQQGLPPEYLIPDPKNFDYNRFVNVFGNSLDKNVFNAHKEELANLIIFYWKRKRAIWTTEVRQEIALEKYTPEEAQKLFEEIKKDPQKLAALRNLGTLNLTYGGRQITEELAGLASPSSPEMKAFQTQQKALIEKYLEAEIAKLPKAEQQKTLKVFFEFYTPGVVYQEYSVEIFQSQIAPQINPMDFYMLQMAEELGPEAFAADGGGYVQRAFAPGENYQGTDFMDSAVGQTGKKLATKALSQGLYLALDAAGGWGEALRAAEVAAPIIKKLKEQLIEMGLEKVIEFVKKNWPLILLGMILSALAALLPWLLLLAPAYFLLKNGFGGLKDFFSGASNLLGQTSGNQVGIGTQTALQNQGLASQLPQGAKTLANQYYSSTMATAGQAVLATVGVTTVFVFVYQTSLNSAFLTDFPFNESEIINSVEKTSKYAEIKKTAKITKGCANPENDGAKCENPSFPLSIEYTVTIKPKEDFSLQITNIEDEIKFKQSQKGWEESGKPIPSIESQKILGFDFFKDLISDQVGLSNAPLNVTPTPTYSPDNETVSESEEPIVEGDFIVIPAGDSLTFTYTLDDLSASYNHTAILNTIEVNFYYQNAFMAGTDNVITAARVCLGECGGGAGCWPTTGTIWQLPFGPYTHGPPGNTNNSWGDSYDIGCNGCSGAAIYGPPVYARFDGNLCFKRCDDNQYGCRYILEFQYEGQTYYEDYAHFQEANPALNVENTCMPVEAGFMIGLMSNRGIGDVHLHWGIVNGAGGGWWSSKPASSITEQLVPETDNGHLPALVGDPVTTCYE